MSTRETGPDADRKRAIYTACADVVAFACILVIAGRPDGLAITLSAVIVAAAAVLFRCTLGVKARMADRSRKSASRQALDRTFRPPVPEPPPPVVPSRAASKSWLRDDD